MDSFDWATSDFQDAMDESQWGSSGNPLNDFTNIGDYSDSPGAFNFRTPSKGPDMPVATGAQQQSPNVANAGMSENSSQDSSSDSSSRRKRKTASESPMSDPILEMRPANRQVKPEESPLNVNTFQNPNAFQQTFGQTLPTLDQSMADSNDNMFDFNSAASSPNLPRDFNQQLSLDAKMNIPSSTAPQFAQQSPVQTINPGMFNLGGSRDQSPITNNTMLTTASPNALFSTPSSDSNDIFATDQNWNGNLSANPPWPTDFSSQFASPSGLNFTPSPAANGGTPSMSSRGLAARAGKSPLHIGPMSAKSRVETQINVVMTLEKPPPGTEYLHLPLHTIAKSKLLAKEDYDKSKVLELHTMLVCTSAMHNSELKVKALQRAAIQDNEQIQQHAESQRDVGDEEKNDIKNVDEEDKPSNGGEVKICSNCIQRERKRAGRKKLKKEEEQQHWERYETERVVVFNSNEFLPFKPSEQRDQRDGMSIEEQYDPPPGALSVAAAMRIACYCRHQSEKEGFQVIFTLKDQQGNVVAQEISESILITDDHKTHPPTMASVSSEMLFHTGQLPQNGLPTSYSMMDLPSHAQPFPSSRSAGNLQALAYGQQLYNPHSHVHQLANNGYVSQATSATMTPTSLSRPGSPNSAGQAGPNKKRKSASFHKRVPSGLQMTPRVDTNQPSSSNLSSGVPMSANFSPSRGAFMNQNSDPSYMTLPNNAAQMYGSGPSTPANENPQFMFNHPHQLDIARAQNASAYFSHPSSAVPSRSNSPVLQHPRPNIVPLRQPIQTPTNNLNRMPQMFGGAQAAPGSAGSEFDQSSAPSLVKITPNEGPSSGGTEVSIFGYNFTHSTQILFGDKTAQTTFYGSQSILAVAPPGQGMVRVKIAPTPGTMAYPALQSQKDVFTYRDYNPKMMEMALRYLSQQHYGDPTQWQQYTSHVANQFMQTSISPAGLQGQGYGSGNMLAAGPAEIEGMVLKVLSQCPSQPCYDLRSEGGQTMLSLATAQGMHSVAAALLARGAYPDTRDNGGYTPLMHAALQDRQRTFQLLLANGADPAIRSLQGYAAVDLVPAESRDTFLQMLHNTKRSRSTRPSLDMRNSFGSHASHHSWDISSASFYESEVEMSEQALSIPPSRRPSDNSSMLPVIEPHAEAAQPAPPAAMMVWREALAAQIHHFQQAVHSSMSHFQLPALPPLPDYQDNAMVRRLSLLVPGRQIARPAQELGVTEDTRSSTPRPRLWDGCAPTTTSPPPPAYSELFPEGVRSSGDIPKGAAVENAIVDSIADEKCAQIFDQQSQTSTSSSSTSAQVRIPNHAERTLLPSWLWASFVMVITTIIFQQILIPYISAMLWLRSHGGGVGVECLLK